MIDPQGNTPLVRINSLSNALGVEILGKAEVRDTVAICRHRFFIQHLRSFAVPQPRGKRKGPRRAQKYVQHGAINAHQPMTIFISDRKRGARRAPASVHWLANFRGYKWIDGHFDSHDCPGSVSEIASSKLILNVQLNGSILEGMTQVR